VSEAAVAEHGLGIEPAESPLTPESWGKLGMWVFLAADAMSFGGLLAGYGALRYGDPTWPPPSSILGIQLTAFMTFLLICSSVTMVEALGSIRQGNRDGLIRFLLLTIMGGMTFLGLQAYEWTKLIVHEGQSVSHNNFGATFFILTGFHGCHVFGGVTYLSAVLGRAVRGVSGAIVTAAVAVVATLVLIVVISSTMSGLPPVVAALSVAAVAAVAGGIVYAVANGLKTPTGVYSAHNNNEVEIAALYWHFVDLIWILVFTFVYLIPSGPQ
jgi:heme/copper-type cytochrome/quinol oxidase subunit 3